MGLAASWERWDAGLIPGPAQWVKDPALLQPRLGSGLWLGSDLWPWDSIGCGLAKNGEKKKNPLFTVCMFLLISFSSM